MCPPGYWAFAMGRQTAHSRCETSRKNTSDETRGMATGRKKTRSTVEKGRVEGDGAANLTSDESINRQIWSKATQNQQPVVII